MDRMAEMNREGYSNTARSNQDLLYEVRLLYMYMCIHLLLSSQYTFIYKCLAHIQSSVYKSSKIYHVNHYSYTILTLLLL